MGHSNPEPSATGKERLRIPRSIFAAALVIPDVKVRHGSKEKSITFQKAAIQAVQKAAEEHIVMLVHKAVSLPSFKHKTLMANDFTVACSS